MFFASRKCDNFVLLQGLSMDLSPMTENGTIRDQKPRGKFATKKKVGGLLAKKHEMVHHRQNALREFANFSDFLQSSHKNGAPSSECSHKNNKISKFLTIQKKWCTIFHPPPSKQTLLLKYNVPKTLPLPKLFYPQPPY